MRDWARAFAIPKSMMRMRLPVFPGDQDVGRFQVAVNDSLLVSVLDGAADLQE